MSSERLRSCGERRHAADIARKIMAGSIDVKSMRPAEKAELAICFAQTVTMFDAFTTSADVARGVARVIAEGSE